MRLHIRDGTSQTSRILPALKDHYFDLVDMRFHALMAMAVDYAGKMRFINLNLEQEGDWKPYFTADETIMIALMLSTDTNKLVTLFKHRQYPVKYRPEAVRALQAVLPAEYRNQIIALYCVTGILDSWLVALRSSDTVTGHELHKLIAGIVSGLGNDLQLLIGCINRYFPKESLDYFFSKDWIKLLVVPRSGSTGGAMMSHINTISLSDPVALRSTFHALIKAIEMIQTRAAKLLPATLQNQQHDPGAGLLIAFVQLFERLQQKINRFASNNIDFYYEQILDAQLHPYTPDHMYLVARLSHKKQPVLISRNTMFPAKLNNSQQAVFYTSEADVYVNGATVETIHTLFFNRDPLNSPENALNEQIEPVDEQVDCPDSPVRRRQLVTECRWNTIPILTEESIEEQANKKAGFLAYPIFGAPKDNDRQYFFGEHARVGFALASKTLLLKEGSRRIHITLKFSDPEVTDESKTLTDWIRKIAIVLKSSADKEATTAVFSEEEEHDCFYKIFSNLFIIHLSTESGWLSVDEYVPAYSGVESTLNENSLRIGLTLPPDAPAVLPYSGSIHGEQFETQLPVIKFMLNPRGYLYPYGILDKLSLNSIRIDVSVTGYHSVILHNQLGPLSTQAAFSPFGPLPEVGSFLVVGCPEAVAKQLTGCSVEIQWGGLPSGMGGFKSYYRGYNGPQDYTDFKISKAVLSKCKWFPANSEPAVSDTLFQIRHASESKDMLHDTRIIACNELLPYWNAAEYQNIPNETGYTQSRKNGFFKFTLIEPTDAFGHKKYPQILSSVLTHNARQRLMKKLKEEPNAPYTPLINSIHVNYQASVSLTGKKTGTAVQRAFRDQLIHLHPLGWENDVLKPGRTVSLAPHLPFSGNLLIGLKDFEPGRELTLYFYLRENALPSKTVIRQKLHWFCLSSNQWAPLTDRQIISDSTQGFMTSGLVTLDIPSTINRNNTIMPDHLCWLRVSADTDLEKFCSLYSIYAQGIRVVRSVTRNEPDNGNRILFDPVPPGSIKQPQQSIPGLDNVWQIQPSIGGKSTEDKKALRVRMSERIWHKNRAIQPVDYERMILEYFPQLYKVKCFANLLPEYNVETQHTSPQIRPGHITLVLLPFPDHRKHHDNQLWVSGHLISKVREFVARYISAFVNVHFVNPVYETVQVRCTVKLKRKRSVGKLIEQLNEAVSAFISPWNDSSGYTTHFGWRISKHELQSYIQQLDYIDRVTNFSLLRISPQGNALFALTDSAAEERSSAGFCEITPRYPWSIAVPMRRHFIEVDDSFDMIAPEITGLGELEIGSTFVISD